MVREIKDLTGFKFGRLTVESLYAYKNLIYYWTCVCECGAVKIANGSNLKKGMVKSCGCLNNGRPIVDLAGNVYGRLLVKELAHTTNGHAYWLCGCICGKEKVIKAASLKQGITKSCGCLRMKDKL